MKVLLLCLAVLMLIAAPFALRAESPWVTDYDLFLALYQKDLELFKCYFARSANWKTMDRNGNTLIYALVDPASISLPEDGDPQSGTGTVSQPTGPVNVKWRTSPSGTVNLRMQTLMEIIRFLVNRGVDINRANLKGETPLHRAVRPAALLNPEFLTTRQDVGGGLQAAPDPAMARDFVSFLLKLGADPLRRDADGRTPLSGADPEFVPLLVKHGADIHERDANGMILFLAASPKKALVLLELGADAHATDSRGRNRWHFLSRQPGWNELANKLLEIGVDINRPDQEGTTPLLRACRNGDLDLARFMMEHGGDVTAMDKNRETPLHAAAKGNNLELMEGLLQWGAPVNARDQSGATPLFLARWQRKMVELLLRHNADPTATTNLGENVLHGLAESSQPKAQEVLALLIRHRAPVNQRNAKGETPLVRAFKQGSIDSMRLLLKNGADPNIPTAEGWTLLDLAELEGRREEMELLRSYRAYFSRFRSQRRPGALLIGFIALGIFPLFTFFFSLLKPSRFTKGTLWTMLVPLAFLLASWLAASGFKQLVQGSDMGPVYLIFSMPPLAALLMSLSGTRALADRVSPRLGIPLSFLNAVGCMGLTLGLAWLYFPGSKGEGILPLGLTALFGGGTAAVITLAIAFASWKEKARWLLIILNFLIMAMVIAMFPPRRGLFFWLGILAVLAANQFGLLRKTGRQWINAGSAIAFLATVFMLVTFLNQSFRLFTLKDFSPEFLILLLLLLVEIATIVFTTKNFKSIKNRYQ